MPDEDDNLSWHATDDDIVDVSMRPARRMDVWLVGDRVEVDAAYKTVKPFQAVVAWRYISTVSG